MEKHTYIGLIDCGVTGTSFAEQLSFPLEGLQVKKAFAFHEGAKNALQKRFPDVEWATDCDAILHDEAIGFVLFSAPSPGHRGLIGAALRANKQVQIV
ncbi:MAG TPA: hypothetical protein VFT06_16715 [Flavisolibacter sp.]|nr:hypothetical protein [Flavisolibacter sp.]